MSQLTAPIVDGVLQQSDTAITTTNQPRTGNSELGKDAFLQLLVCQLQNQDPLNPSSDTEFVAQLATFSQLEQLQNLAAVSEQSKAFSLVGKEVIVQGEDSNGRQITVSGIVDFITINKGKVKLSVDGDLYDLDKLVNVIDTDYIIKQNSPAIKEKITYEYDAENPEDLVFEVFMGDKDMKAEDVALVLLEQVLDSSMISINGNKVTVKKEAFAYLPNGTYKPAVVFDNDPYYTSIENKLVITVKNSSVIEEDGETDTGEEETTE